MRLISRSENPVFLEPVDLGLAVAEDDVALFVLETPGDDDQEVAFPDPGPLLYLAFDAPHAGDPVVAADADMVGPEHQFGPGELLEILLSGHPYTGDLFGILVWLVKGQEISSIPGEKYRRSGAVAGGKCLRGI